MSPRICRLAWATGSVLCVGGCSGGTGGTAFAPASIPAPKPPPPPQVSTAGIPLGEVTSSQEFATAGYNLQIRWDEPSKTYEVKLPSSEWSTLVAKDSGSFDVALNGTTLTSGNGAKPADGYASTGILHLWSTGGEERWTAFGIPTAASQIPVTGTATYLGDLRGYDQVDSWISGEAKFRFDFGAGTLSGYFHPIANGGWSGGDLGQYDFASTIYRVGSTSFSGGLKNSTTLQDGAFNGSFNGPGAGELMGGWMIHFNPCQVGWCDPANPVSTATGVVVAKKQ